MASDDFRPTFGKCNQCGLFHPPLKSGETCPMAKEKTSDGTEINLNPFFSSMKNILTANIKKNNIKDIQKFTGNLIIELNKIIETYKE
jgi:hypothetical protein